MASRVSDAAQSRPLDTEGHRPRGGVHPHIDLLPNWRRDIAARSGWLVAITFGVLAVFIVRLSQFHYTVTAMISDTPAITTAVEAGAGVVLSFLAFLLVPYRGAKYVFLLLVGVALCTTAMHNAVHKAPGIFALTFAPDWTERVVASTEPNSLLIAGNVIPLSPPKSEEKALPTVLRLN